jgi:hypothetical protein
MDRTTQILSILEEDVLYQIVFHSRFANSGFVYV